MTKQRNLEVREGWEILTGSHRTRDPTAVLVSVDVLWGPTVFRFHAMSIYPFITTLFLFYFAYCENLLFLQPKNPDWNEVVGWDGKLSVSRVGASEPKFEGHLTCTGWVLGGAVWQRADAKSRWRGRLLWSFGTRRATIKSTLMTEARLGWDFHSGAWIIFGIPFLDYPLRLAWSGWVLNYC